MFIFPFGLCNAPATFQRIMDHALGRKIGARVLVYKDDVVIYAKDFDDYCENLAEVLKILKSQNLKCKSEKCCFGCKEIKFLGHSISAEEIKPDDDQIITIVQAKVPVCEKDVPFFLFATY